MQSTLKSNWSESPLQIYRKNLRDLPADVYASGNRSATGTLKKAQHAKSQMRLQSSRPSDLHRILLSIDKEQNEEDEQNAVLLGHDFRVNGIRGYIQGINVDNLHIRLVLFDEPMIRLFHVLSTRDILYLDATGNIIERIKPYKQIYYYALTVRHSFGLASPIPVAEYITSSHTTESLRHFFLTVREKEGIVFQGCLSKPKLLICDLSIPLYESALLEFNKETINEYLNRTFKIINGTAEDEELNLMLVHLCCAHSINSAKRKLTSIYGKDKSKIHFGLRFFGRLLSCCELDESVELVKHGYNVMTSKYVSSKVEDSVTFLQNSINTFLRPQNDEEVETESETTTPRIELENIACHREDNIWVEYWDNVLDNCEQTNKISASSAEENQYHMYEFFEYLKKYILPLISMLSKMCLGDLRHLSDNYDGKVEVTDTAGARSHLINNTTNATVEKLFAIQKSNKAETKLPLQTFLTHHWHDLQALQRQFWDGIMKGINDRKYGTVNKTHVRSLKCSFTKGISDEEVPTKKSVPEEKWRATPKKGKKPINATYMKPPKQSLHFSPHTDTY